MKHTLLIVDHGSRLPDAARHLDGVAERVRAGAPELDVRVAHLEFEKPTLPEAVAQALADGAQRISIHPFFLSPGRHLNVDIPGMLDRMKREHPDVEIELLEPVGSRPEIADLILLTLGAPSA